MTGDAEKAWEDIVTKAIHTLALDTLHRAERKVLGDPDHGGLIKDYGRSSVFLERITDELTEHLARSSEEVADMMASLHENRSESVKPWDIGTRDDDFEMPWEDTARED